MCCSVIISKVQMVSALGTRFVIVEVIEMETTGTTFLWIPG